jgi:uncharacterized protein YjgD (DUF1641 family)
MAEPILFKPPPRDPREGLYQRLENAPKEHVEALLVVCDILQGFHDRGILELAKGALGSSEKVLQILVNTANIPEVIRGIRNAMILAKIVDSIDPNFSKASSAPCPKAWPKRENRSRLDSFPLLRKLLSPDTRRVLIATATILESLGKSLGSKKSP